MTDEIRQSLITDIYRNIPPPPGTCLLAFRGSIAHGMWLGDFNDPFGVDDIDLMGIVLGTPRNYLGLYEWGSRGTLEIKQGRWDVVYYEIRKMFSLLLQGNPNVLSLLWVRPEDYLLLTPAGKLIVDNRHLFVGKHVRGSFAGYANAQIQKMESRDPAELRDYLALTYEAKVRGIHPNHKGEVICYPVEYDRSSGEARNAIAHTNDTLLAKLSHYMKKGDNTGYLGDKRKQLILEHSYDSKNAAHCIRLLRMAIEFLHTGELTVYRPDAVELLDIKRGKWTLEQIKSHAKELFEDIHSAYAESTLPEGPDNEGAESLLVSILTDHITNYNKDNT